MSHTQSTGPKHYKQSDNRSWPFSLLDCYQTLGHTPLTLAPLKTITTKSAWPVFLKRTGLVRHRNTTPSEMHLRIMNIRRFFSAEKIIDNKRLGIYRVFSSDIPGINKIAYINQMTEFIDTSYKCALR